MVDREDDEAATMPARPVCSKQGQGVGIPAARQADGDRGRGLMLQTLVQDGANAGLKIGDRRRQAAHLAWVRAAAARLCTAAGALG